MTLPICYAICELGYTCSIEQNAECTVPENTDTHMHPNEGLLWKFKGVWECQSKANSFKRKYEPKLEFPEGKVQTKTPSISGMAIFLNNAMC